MNFKRKNNIMISKKAGLVEASGIRKIFHLIQNMKNPINLSIGQVHFDTPDEVKNVATKAVNDGFNRYTVTRGIPELIEGISNNYKKKTGIKPSKDEVIITSGASGALLLSFFAILNDDDEVLIPDPYFIMYKNLVHMAGANPVFVNTYPNFKITPEILELYITNKTKILVFNNPVNPTGIAYTREEIDSIVSFAKDKNLFIISDEVYDKFNYDFDFTTLYGKYDRTVVINAFSKSFAVPGWRVGYACAPLEIIEGMATMQQFSYVCSPAPLQKACAYAINVDLQSYYDDYKHKRDYIFNELKDYYDIVKPQGSFYMFPKVPKQYLSAEEFVNEAIKHDLLVVPGNACSLNDTHFRLSYAADDAELEKGVEILIKLAKEK